jgi:hypothetical protein
VTVPPVATEAPLPTPAALAPPGPAAAPVAAAPVDAAASEETLRQIYRRETDNHVATVNAWIAAERKLPAPHVVPETVFRACHTLSGSSQMAEARHGIRLTEPLNLWLR